MTTIDKNQESITLENAQELITNKQVTIMQQAEEFTDQLIQLQKNESKILTIQEEQNQADNLLTNL